MTQIKAEYIDHMGDDLRVVNAARVSFDKESKWEYKNHTSYDEMETYVENFKGATISNNYYSDNWYGNYSTFELSEKDKKLIKYLADHNHWTPFSHPQITLRISAPIFLARQLFKHKVGFTENEVSRRYVDSEPEFYVPDVWRKRADNKKQGSSDEPVDEPLHMRFTNSVTTSEAVIRFYNYSLDLYKDLLENDTCPEQARMVLPQSMMTSWYWTGSLVAWSRLYNLRSSPDAQREHELLMNQIDGIISPLFPVSWDSLKTI